MRHLADGDVMYADTFVFNATLLFIMLVGLPPVAWVEFTRNPPNYLLTAISVAGAIVSAYGLATLQRRIYVFSPSRGMMLWTSRGIFRRSSGEVPFKDLAVTIEAGPFISWFARNSPLSQIQVGSPPVYDIVLSTGNEHTYLGSSYNDCPSAVKEASDLRRVMGQNPDSLVTDSIAQMSQAGNKRGAEALQRQSSAASTVVGSRV